MSSPLNQDHAEEQGGAGAGTAPPKSSSGLMAKKLSGVNLSSVSRAAMRGTTATLNALHIGNSNKSPNVSVAQRTTGDCVRLSAVVRVRVPPFLKWAHVLVVACARGTEKVLRFKMSSLPLYRTVFLAYSYSPIFSVARGTCRTCSHVCIGKIVRRYTPF